MGLLEKRKIKELQETVLPERLQELLEITGSPITYDIDWDSFDGDLEGLNFMDNLSCHRTNMALRVLCADELGKEAVQEGVKVIRLKNVRDKGDMCISLKDGVLEMRCAYALRTDGMFSDNEIRKFLEDNL